MTHPPPTPPQSPDPPPRVGFWGWLGALCLVWIALSVLIYCVTWPTSSGGGLPLTWVIAVGVLWVCAKMKGYKAPPTHWSDYRRR